ncbi:MAG: hypothetical protein EXQ58_04255 [Acidobacteria bacterium]|nr:hypothetical protein [Acidobacteriota bacterium]
MPFSMIRWIRFPHWAAIAPGPFDQKPNESRTDVLVYSTPSLEKDTEVTGYISLDLFAASSASDTDFYGDRS